jgi:hypothetical protein
MKSPKTRICKNNPMRITLCSESSGLLLLVYARIAPPKACMRKQRTSPPIEYFGETHEANLAEGNTTGCSYDAAKGHIHGCGKEDRSEQYGRGLHDLYAHDCGRGYPEYARAKSGEFNCERIC